jgi:hypothetical protein
MLQFRAPVSGIARALRRTVPWDLSGGNWMAEIFPAVRRGGRLGRAFRRPFLVQSPRLSFGGGRMFPGRTLEVTRGTKIVTWLILPVVICLSQRLSHACLSISNLYGETANGSLNQLSFI